MEVLYLTVITVDFVCACVCVFIVRSLLLILVYCHLYVLLKALPPVCMKYAA